MLRLLLEGYAGFIEEGQAVKPNERQERIEWLLLWTGWHRQLFDNKTDKEILVLFERYRNIV